MNRTTRHFILTLAALLPTPLAALGAAETAKPNIVIIYIDDKY